jgi:hypothetical protein
MKLIETPVHNEDGSVKYTLMLNEVQQQTLLQFALNFLVATGLAANYGIPMVTEDVEVVANQKYDA